MIMSDGKKIISKEEAEKTKQKIDTDKIRAAAAMHVYVDKAGKEKAAVTIQHRFVFVRRKRTDFGNSVVLEG